MGLWTFLTLIIIVPVLVGAFNEYQKNKLRFKSNNQQIGELHDEIKSLKKRIENLEIIAVSDPDNFQDRFESDSTIDPETYSDKSGKYEGLVNDLARKKQSS